MQSSRKWAVPVLAVALLFLATPRAGAQNLSPNMRGDAGLKSGSQPGPGIYIAVPYLNANYAKLKGPNGNDVPRFDEGSINILPVAVNVTTKWKLLGAHYGFLVATVYNNQALTLATPEGLTRDNSLGRGDSYFQPLTLGWHTKRADITTGYGFFAPTGNGVRTTDMWTHQFSGGTTVYFDEAKKWHAAAMAWYTASLKKRSMDMNVGDYLTIEGGVGRSFLKGAANVGLAYSVQTKTTNDSGKAIPAFLPIRLSQGYAVGPEFSMPVFAKGTLVALVGVRWTKEFSNVYSFQGNSLALSLTVANLFKP